MDSRGLSAYASYLRLDNAGGFADVGEYQVGGTVLYNMKHLNSMKCLEETWGNQMPQREAMVDERGGVAGA